MNEYKIDNKKDFKGFMIGTILGDSSLCGRKNKYLFTGHAESQYNYMLWKLETISEFIPVHYSITEKKQNSINKQRFFRAHTNTHHKITHYYNFIYKDNKKVISEYVLKNFNTVSLATLFMDDGSKEACFDKKYQVKKLKSYKISLGNFTYEDVILLSEHLKKNFGLHNSVYLEKRKYPIIRISRKADRERFKNIIEPYMHKDLMYKLSI
ncbi:hypothetical protein [Siminovitchia sp. 179-K 8D1 HS]|uniref:hypothetical protein n=1 Tax=Siminovitchia sp. 179-K 8D1 HS TaxID=3142385 RepID=UPI0039A364E1